MATLRYRPRLAGNDVGMTYRSKKAHDAAKRKRKHPGKGLPSLARERSGYIAHGGGVGVNKNRA